MISAREQCPFLTCSVGTLASPLMTNYRTREILCSLVLKHIFTNFLIHWLSIMNYFAHDATDGWLVNLMLLNNLCRLVRVTNCTFEIYTEIIII